MSFLACVHARTPLEARRAFLGNAGLVLSGSAVALLAGRDSLAASAAGGTEADARILNTALASELEAVAAYQAGAESGLLKPPSRELALAFQGHHRQHADALAGTITKLGGTPVSAKARYRFPLETLRSEADVLRFAAGLEKGAVSAYLGAVPHFANRSLSQVAASILGDEAMHWAILRNAVGEVPVPAAFVS